MNKNLSLPVIPTAFVAIALFALGGLVGNLTAPDPAPVQTTPYLYGVTDEWVDCVREAGSTAADLSDPETLRRSVAKSLEFDYCTEYLG